MSDTPQKTPPRTGRYPHRADTRDVMRGGIISRIESASPAEASDLAVGMHVLEADGHVLHDRMDWLWYADDVETELTVADPITGDVSQVVLRRDLGEDWGIIFTDELFDGMYLCRNSCTFCFMRMLPKGLRRSLYLRDDDFRLSFTQGNFVTLTNITDEQAERIIEQRLTPLHVSVHAVSPRVREGLIGRNAARGLEVMERLLEAGIEVHTQIVLVPDVNDGDELVATIRYLAGFQGMLSCGIVPLGFTDHQTAFSHSFDESAAAAQVIDLVDAENARDTLRDDHPRFLPADAFYLDAHRDIPDSSFYGDYDTFEDGIGMVRWTIDDSTAWRDEIRADEKGRKDLEALLSSIPTAVALTGRAFEPVLRSLIDDGPLAGHVKVRGVDNRFFGGNVDVAGLLCGADLLDAIRDDFAVRGDDTAYLVPESAFNADGRTLDDYTIADLCGRSGHRCIVVSCWSQGLIDALESLSDTRPA